MPYLLLPSISYSLSSSTFLSSSSSSCSSSLRSFGKPAGPPSSPAGDRHWPPPPPGSKILTGFKLFTSYKIVKGITRLWFSDLCNPDRTWRTNIKTEKELKNKKTELKRTKNITKKNQKEPLRTEWQFWYFPKKRTKTEELFFLLLNFLPQFYTFLPVTLK